MKKNFLIFVVLILIFPVARADSLNRFLMSCVYGTAAGALLGVTSLAFSDNPGGQTNNIARGASLGLYVGMGVGLVQISNSKKESSEVWLEPKWKFGKVEGMGVTASLVNF